jgi:hypothetical protein
MQILEPKRNVVVDAILAFHMFKLKVVCAIVVFAIMALARAGEPLAISLCIAVFAAVAAEWTWQYFRWAKRIRQVSPHDESGDEAST